MDKQTLLLLKAIRCYCYNVLLDSKEILWKFFMVKQKRNEQLLVELSSRCKVYYVNVSLGVIGAIGNDSLIKKTTYFACKIKYGTIAL